MTSKELLKETKQIILNNAKKRFIKDFVILDYNLNIIEKELEILDILKEWLVYDEREEAIMTYIDIPLDLMEKLKGWLGNNGI